MGVEAGRGGVSRFCIEREYIRVTAVARINSAGLIALINARHYGSGWYNGTIGIINSNYSDGGDWLRNPCAIIYNVYMQRGR